jgi:hypothetical protein
MSVKQWCLSTDAPLSNAFKLVTNLAVLGRLIFQESVTLPIKKSGSKPAKQTIPVKEEVPIKTNAKYASQTTPYYFHATVCFGLR